MDQAFSFSSIIDNLLVQLHSIQQLCNNIETAISFARLNILHSSIIEPNQIRLIIDKLEEIYNTQNIPKLRNLMDYYSLLSTQTTIRDKLILFKIHIPIVSSQYKYFQIFPVPILNQTIITEQPYILLNTEDYWSTSEKCPEVEDWYFCRQETLHKHQPCLAELLQNGKNTCPRTTVHFSETSTTQIDANKILIITAEPTKIRSLCNTEGIHEIAKPSIISLNGCRVSTGGKEFQTEQTTHEEFLFELPEVELPPIYEENRKTLHLKNIDQEQILQINTFANNRITKIERIKTSMV
ncbi:hypothetical protein HHI36_022504 [Cryptolaemus montrouzieri]|uniref:Envelope protein n=1 Tax=Cryptolaemus montrouzieri TaxID=559131 RepID=A0ABD2N0F3_9CUCU